MSSFSCQSLNSGDIQQFQWLVNGTRLEDFDQTDGIMTTVKNDFGILALSNISLEYNETTIQCIITLTSGENISSNDATLLVQGEPYVDTLLRSEPCTDLFDLHKIAIMGL